MQVGAGGQARAAHVADELSGGDGLSPEARTDFYRALDRFSHNLQEQLAHNSI